MTDFYSFELQIGFDDTATASLRCKMAYTITPARDATREQPAEEAQINVQWVKQVMDGRCKYLPLTGIWGDLYDAQAEQIEAAAMDAHEPYDDSDDRYDRARDERMERDLERRTA